jgi:ubiquinone/menaquinone biosynthesis C-methylase UbiE/protein-tyrosine-phosphatase
MAQAFLARAGFEARSAGTRPEAAVHPNVAEAMVEVGVDLSGREPHKLSREDVEWADLVVTMGCGDECPVIVGKEYRDWALDDPKGRSLEETRAIRDEVRRRVNELAVELAVEASGYREEGFAELYDRCRPRAPSAIAELLCVMAGVERPKLVVDLGSGTGLSTEVWAGRAEEVVGVEPNPAMRAIAEERAPAGVRYLDASSLSTGLEDGSVDVVTASQSLHWMDPDATFAESARILRPGGVFAAYDYSVPPVVQPEVDEVFERVCERVSSPKAGIDKEHLERMRESGRFRRTRELFVHGVEEGDAERVIGFALSLGTIAGLTREGSTEDELGLTDLRAVAKRVIGDRPVPWFVGYRVRVGIR